ncbi:Fe2+-enterobactin ABC transporter substrate-binding protein [Serratia ficaria]|uniref:Fe2+-enterobactin ABC transporter substrate-binding protein n=1 Tax=Serratia ficaria TaxID=61651 RepID=UPI00217C87A9|nr:Fe2+-enterobactin ABC transporter substrate-binding protein [Serratia ficaria]CAI2045572.1 Ferrienterobactin-binding periplasmic protein precursor [Serratia ficaria]
MTLSLRHLFISLIAASGLLLSGCGPDDQAGAQTPASDAANGGWPRTINSAKGPFTLEKPPLRIVSTSVTLTGTLLAIDAPVIASGATSANSSVSDDQGFFTQWGEVAKRRNVKPLYQVEPNAEAVAAANPDLIVISSTGGDSALKLYDQLSTVAPTLVLNYGDKSWQQLATQLGEITGHEQGAKQAEARFEQRVEQVKQSIALPPQPTSPLVYDDNGREAKLWTPDSAQGKLLTQLSFRLATPPESAKGNTSMGKRQDIIQLSGEKMAEGLNGKTLMLFSADQRKVGELLANPFLRHLEPVEQHHVYAVGTDTFRLDYYSATNMLNSIERQFKKS